MILGGRCHVEVGVSMNANQEMVRFKYPTDRCVSEHKQRRKSRIENVTHCDKRYCSARLTAIYEPKKEIANDMKTKLIFDVRFRWTICPLNWVH